MTGRDRRRLSDLTPSARTALGRLIWAFVRAGWNPPVPSDEVYERILDDIKRQTLYGRTEWKPGASTAPTLELTPFQIRALCMFADGGTYRSIARQTGRTEESIKEALKYARSKLGARNTTHAVAIAIRNGVIV